MKREACFFIFNYDLEKNEQLEYLFERTDRMDQRAFIFYFFASDILDMIFEFIFSNVNPYSLEVVTLEWAKS